MKEKAYELRQKRANVVDEMRVLTERITAENREFTADEKTAFDAHETEARSLAARVSTIERTLAAEAFGPEPESRATDVLPHEDPANAKGRRYSLLKAVRCFAEKRQFDGLEAEVSQELAKRSGKTPQGFLMPTRTSAALTDAERRTLDVSLTSSGAAAVPTILSHDWIELLRNAMRVKQAGASEILDLQGKFAIPRQNAASQGYWVAENGAPSGSSPTLDQIAFTPHTAGAYTDITRRFFELANIDGDAFVKQDLAAVLGRLIDLAALNGTGASNQPQGLLQNGALTTGRTVSLGANGGAPTWQTMVEMQTIVSRGNATQLGPGTYLGNADVTGTLATTPKLATTAYPIFLLEGDKVYGKPYLETQQLPNNLTKGTGTGLSPIIYGIWSQLVMAYWTGLDVLVDPYTGSSSGTVRIVALQDMDIQVRHNEAFSFVLDMVSNQTQ